MAVKKSTNAAIRRALDKNLVTKQTVTTVTQSAPRSLAPANTQPEPTLTATKKSSSSSAVSASPSSSNVTPSRNATAAATPNPSSSGSIFTQPFFSLGGQWERIKNVGATLNAAFNPFSSSTVIANVENKTLKSALETTANHPYITAGVLATSYQVATHIPQITASIKSFGSAGVLRTAAGTAPAGIKTGLTTLGLVGGGILAGSILSGSKASNAPQTTSQDQNTNPNIDPIQDNRQDNSQDNRQFVDYSIQDSPGASISGSSPTQSPNFAPSMTPFQYVPSQFIPSQSAEQRQTADSGGMNWGMVALVVGAAVLLTRK